MTYTVEDIRKILEETDCFDFTKINNNGEKVTLSADMIFFENCLINDFKTKEFCVALKGYDFCNITPISKIIKII